MMDHTLTFVKVFTCLQTAVLCMLCWHGKSSCHMFGLLEEMERYMVHTFHKKLCLARDALNVNSAGAQIVLCKYSFYQIMALQLAFKVCISTSSDDSRPLQCRQLCTQSSSVCSVGNSTSSRSKLSCLASMI